MRPANLKTKIFLDSGDPNKTREVINLLGFLDGQTTNPSLIYKNPRVAQRLIKGEKFTQEEILEFYKVIVQEISLLMPNCSISIEVPADKNSSAEEMLSMGREMFSWIPNAHIKFPTNKEGLTAAEKAIQEGLRLNMTLCFSQEQAAAVYAATNQVSPKSSLNGFKNIFVSPFIGRLDDIGENGMDLIKNIIHMYENSDHHVAVLTASVRKLNHLWYALALGSDIVTAPFNVLKEWIEKGLYIPDQDFISSENTSQFTAGMNARNKLVPLGYPAASSGEGFIYDSDKLKYIPYNHSRKPRSFRAGMNALITVFRGAGW